MAGETIRLAASTTQAQLLALVEQLNEDAQVHGILVQSPLPKQIDDAQFKAIYGQEAERVSII